MFRPARQRKAVVAVALAIAALGASAAAAQDQAQNRDAKLVTACAPPSQAEGKRTAVCKLRATGFAEFRDVIARIAGESTNLEARFEPFDPERDGSTTAYLIQMMPNARRATLAQMADAVASIADPREGRRRFTAYTFADGLTPIAGSGVSRDAFVRQLVAIAPAAGTIHLYKSVLAAVKALADETGARKSLVLLADGTSDDDDATAEDVLAAARKAGVAIHVLGYYDDARQRSKFEALSRLAEETGGYAAEVKRGSGAKNDFTREIVTTSFLTDVVENGGTVTVELTGPAGKHDIAFTVELANEASLTGEAAVSVPAASAPPPPPPAEAPKPVAAAKPEPAEPGGGSGGWVLVIALSALAGLGALAYNVYGRDLFQFFRWWLESEPRADAGGSRAIAAPDAPPAALPPPPVEEPKTVRVGKPARSRRAPEARKDPVVYGWLETLEGDDAARHPLRTTNVRVGRHRDNDICLLNDSISRRHALLHYDPVTRRFTITDLGAGNGVIVNEKRTKSRELRDGDTVELGEVRLRFHAEPEYES